MIQLLGLFLIIIALKLVVHQNGAIALSFQGAILNAIARVEAPAATRDTQLALA